MGSRFIAWIRRASKPGLRELALVFGILHGLAYLFLIPPWQHYDEPGHFEFAWLLANDPAPVVPGVYQQAMRRDLAASMIENDFYRDLGPPPNLLLNDTRIDIGLSQINPRRIYYGFLSLLLRLVSGSDLGFQLYLSRFLSLIFLVSSFLAARKIIADLTRPGHPLRWMVPVSLALLPGFVDIMTAINDDVGATTVFLGFLLISVRLIHKGFSWVRFIALLILAAISYFTKNTVTVAVLLAPLAVLFSFFRGRKHWLVWVIFGLVLVSLILSVFRWGDAAYWYRIVPQDEKTRTLHSDAVIGRHVFRLSAAPGGPLPRLVQIVPVELKEELIGEPVTLGAWVWASEPLQVQMPALGTDQATYNQVVEVGTEPAFFVVHTPALEPTDHLNLILAPFIAAVDHPREVYLDGLVMVAGNFEENHPPVFDDPNAFEGRWEGVEFTNLVRNASAESAWPWLRTWADRLLVENFPGRPSLFLSTTLDFKTVEFYFRSAFIRLFQTFWAYFGWGHVPLVLPYSYRVLFLITLIGVIGSLILLIRNRKHLNWDLLVFLGIVLVAVWSLALLRGTGTLVDSRTQIPVARYAYPAIFPTMLLLNAGWLEVFRQLQARFKLPEILLPVGFCAFFIALDVVSILTILRYYWWS